jgi:general secretion pathway protein G
MNPTEGVRSVERFGEPQDGPVEKKRSTCACLAFGIASIVGVGLVLLVVPNVLQRLAFPSRTKAMVGILEIKEALTSYALAHEGKFPENLEALLQTREDGRPYLRSEDGLRDPWGHEYLYEPPTPEHAEPRILSYGRDGEPGGEGEDADMDSLKFRVEH